MEGPSPDDPVKGRSVRFAHSSRVPNQGIGLALSLKFIKEQIIFFTLYHFRSIPKPYSIAHFITNQISLTIAHYLINFQ